MRALRERPRRDPAPSRLRYRLTRLWRRRWLRVAVKAGAPAVLLLGVLVHAATDEKIRAAGAEAVAALRESVKARPEFAVRRVDVRGAQGDVDFMIRALLSPAIGESSMNIDPAATREAIEQIGWVAAAQVRLEAPETLTVEIRQRRAAAVWRRGARLTLLDAEGREIDDIARRADRADLPLVAGDGADAALGEALALSGASPEVARRLRGLVRVGERRWTAVLDDVDILLPETGAVAAMARVGAMQARDRVLDRDVTVIDLRVAARPTLRLGDAARTALGAKTRLEGEDA